MRARLPFVVSAVFHYLGPAFAVLLFARVDVLGVAWLRIAAAALIFAAWRRPWHLLRDRNVLAWGLVLAVMNCCFYARDRPAAAGDGRVDRVPAGDRARGARDALAPQRRARWRSPSPGVYLLVGLHLEGDPLGVALALANAALFAAYIVLAHRVAGRDARSTGWRRRCSSRSCSSRRWRAGRRCPRSRDPVAIARRHRRRRLLLGDPVHRRPDRDARS